MLPNVRNVNDWNGVLRILNNLSCIASRYLTWYERNPVNPIVDRGLSVLSFIFVF
jgi:hypothetical protein